MPGDASELGRRLARDAEAVCRHYLSKGRRQGRYWMVGDVRNTPGRSMYVRLSGPASGPGAAGRWSDAASAEHGDLLDVIRESCGLMEFREVAEEARRFLSLPRTAPPVAPRAPAPRGSAEAARRLWAIAKPLAGTLAEAYLRNRGIVTVHHAGALRFHPRCWYRPDEHAPHETWPATSSPPVKASRRCCHCDARCPPCPWRAALSANHLAALELPAGLQRLYLAQDDDFAGRRATEALAERARAAGVEELTLVPALDDFNADLRRLGAEVLSNRLRTQLAPTDKPLVGST